jgi:hypothetical protein
LKLGLLWTTLIVVESSNPIPPVVGKEKSRSHECSFQTLLPLKLHLAIWLITSHCQLPLYIYEQGNARDYSLKDQGNLSVLEPHYSVIPGRLSHLPGGRWNVVFNHDRGIWLSRTQQSFAHCQGAQKAAARSHSLRELSTTQNKMSPYYPKNFCRFSTIGTYCRSTRVC